MIFAVRVAALIFALAVFIALPRQAFAAHLIFFHGAEKSGVAVGVGTARGIYLAALAINTFIATAAIFRGFAVSRGIRFVSGIGLGLDFVLFFFLFLVLVVVHRVSRAMAFPATIVRRTIMRRFFYTRRIFVSRIMAATD